MKLRCEIADECSQEIKTALAENVGLLEKNVHTYSNQLKICTDKANEQMKKYNDKMQMHLYDFENKKKNFFQFDGIRSFLFWGGQLINIATFVTLMIFLFRG